MARCGCAGSGTCPCVLQNGSGTTVSGNGSPGSPYAVAVNVDPAPGNLIEATADGVRVDCAAVAACVADQTPGGQTNFVDTVGINFTRTGSGTALDPFEVTADQVPQFEQSAPDTFTHDLLGASDVYELITALDPVVVDVPGTYLVTYEARGSAAIPGSTAAVSTSTSAALYLNGALVPGTERMLALVSQGVAGTAQPALQTQGTASATKVITIAAGQVLTLRGARSGTAGTNTIVSNTQGRTAITATRIGA